MLVSRSIYVPLEAGEFALLLAMAKAERRRSPNDQAAYLITQALERWRIEQALEASFESEAMEEQVA